MTTGYADLDNAINYNKDMIALQEQKGNEIVDMGLQKVQNEVDKQKQEYDENAVKQGRAIYQDYQKEVNQYGVNAENMAAQGLNNSGYSESSRVKMYNNYQKNYAEIVNTTNKLKADADFNMNQAMIEGSIQKAQITMNRYKQQADLALTEYQLKFQRDQWEWEKNHTLEREAVADSQWERQQLLNESKASSKKANSSGGNDNIIDTTNLGRIPTDNSSEQNKEVTAEDYTKNASDGGKFVYGQLASAYRSNGTTYQMENILKNAVKNAYINQNEEQQLKKIFGL